MLRIVPLVLVVLATGLSSARAAHGDADDKAIRDLAERYYAAYATKDLDAFMALWSDKAPDYEAFRQGVKGQFAEMGPIMIRSHKVVRSRRDGDGASVRVRVELVGKDVKTGKPHPSLGALDRVLDLGREAGGWKVLREGPSDRRLMELLAETKSKAERLRYLDDDSDLIGPDFVATVLDEGDAQARLGRFDRASRLQDVAFEAAGGLGDRDALAWCHIYRGLGQDLRSRHEPAMASYRKALALFREANDQEGVWSAHRNIGVVCYSTGRYAEALRHFQDALKITREMGYRPAEATTLGNIGSVYEATGRYAEALQYHQDSLKITRDLGDRAAEAQTLHNIAMVYADTSRYAEALQQYQDSLKITRDLGDRAAEAQTLNNMGIIFQATGRYTEGLQLFEDCLKFTRDLKDLAGEARALGNIGIVYEATGRYPEALERYQDCLKIIRDLGDRAGEAKVLGNIGIVYGDTGRYAEALQYHQNGLKIKRDLGDRAGEAQTLNNIGLIYKDTGRYAEALRQYQDSLRVEREVGYRAGEAGTLNNMGIVYGVIGRYPEALQNYRDSLQIKSDMKDPAGEAATLGNIGMVYQAAGRYPEALRYHRDCLKIERDLADRAGEAHTLNNIGMVYEATGRYPEALQNYRDSLQIKRDLKDRAGEADALGNIGIVYEETARYAEARRQFEGALGVAESIGDLETTVSCHGHLGLVCQAQGQWREAVRAYGEAVRNTELLRTNTCEPSLQTSLLAQKTGLYFYLAECRLELGEPSDAFAAGERMKARGLVDILARGKSDPRRGMSGAERKEEQTLLNRLTALGVQLEDLRSRKADADSQAGLADDLKKARRDYEAFRRELYLHWPDLAARRAEFAPASPDDLGAVLFAGRPGLAVLSYMVGPKETLLFVLTPGERDGAPARLTARRIDVTVKDLAEAVDTFRAACADPAAAAPDAADLYRWLIAPAADELAAAKQVVIVPDGVLHTLPFQALQGPDGTFLVEHVAVSYAPSVTALAKMEELGGTRRKDYAGRPPSLLAVGLSDFGRRERALPAAETEARAVADRFGKGGRLLLAADATRTKVQESWAGCRYLHFATHGRLNPDAPMYSSLVLRPGGAGDEGVLYASDLADADIPAELAVMSACETGLGRRVGGEGLLGLSWSWFAAGVPSTVASQWSVGDASTARLMKTFYARLAAGDSKAEALRQAEVTLLADPATRHPFYWAPFVLVGDDR